MSKATFFMPHALDLRGSGRVKLVPLSDQLLLEATHRGVGFGAAALHGMGLGPETPELLARIDANSPSTLPWDHSIVYYPANLYYGADPHQYCPRNVLIKAIAQAVKVGFYPVIGVEPEHYLVTHDGFGNIAPWDPHGNEIGNRLAFNARMTIASAQYMTTVANWLNELGWGCFVAEKEEGPGQFEINWEPQNALLTADRLALFKLFANKAAEGLGAKATFMAKPFRDRTGSGLHFHCNLCDQGQQNLFMDEANKHGISEIARQFIGGIFHHAAALCAVTNPTVNCFERLGAKNSDTRSGCTWTPGAICWGGNNRTVMIRVPAPGRIEDRSPSPNCNPYLAIACHLAAGIDGILKRMECGPAVDVNVYVHSQSFPQLPHSLKEATAALQEDAVLCDTLGPVADELIHWQLEQTAMFKGGCSSKATQEFLQLF